MAKSKGYRGSFTLVFLCCVLGVYTAVMLLSGITSESDWTTLQTGVLLGVAHLLLRPILRILTAPIGCLTLGAFGFVIDVSLLYFCAYLSDGFMITSVTDALLAAFLINSLCLIVGRKS